MFFLNYTTIYIHSNDIACIEPSSILSTSILYRFLQVLEGKRNIHQKKYKLWQCFIVQDKHSSQEVF